MTGRKRKAGARTPSGQLSRANADHGLSPAAVKRMLDAAAVKAVDPRLGSEVGRLLLAEKLTARQAAAAWKYAEVRSQYLAAIEAPRCKTARLERGQRGQAAEDGTEAGEREKRALVRSVSRHERARGVLVGCGEKPASAVDLLVADVALLTYEQLKDAREGLDALASHFAAA